MKGWITVVDSNNDEPVMSPDVIVQASRHYRGPLLITSLELDDELLASVVHLSGASSLSAAVNMALEQYVSLKQFRAKDRNLPGDNRVARESMNAGLPPSG